jgi:hypothetical protein
MAFFAEKMRQTGWKCGVSNGASILGGFNGTPNESRRRIAELWRLGWMHATPLIPLEHWVLTRFGSNRDNSDNYGDVIPECYT